MELLVPNPDDWAAFRALRLRALEDAPLAFLEKLDVARALGEAEWRHRLAPSPDARTLVVTRDGEWLGMSRITRDDDDREMAWLVAVWLDPRLRGSGAADLMLNAQIDWARTALGATRLHLHVGATNARARALYERLGFEATGEVDTFPGHDEDEQVLARGL